MRNADKTKAQLIEELEVLRQQIAKLLLSVFSFSRLMWRPAQRGLTGVVRGLCLILLIIPLSFALTGGVAFAQEPAPIEVGQWDPPITITTGEIGVHAIVLTTGKVLWVFVFPSG